METSGSRPLYVRQKREAGGDERSQKIASIGGQGDVPRTQPTEGGEAGAPFSRRQFRIQTECGCKLIKLYTAQLSHSLYSPMLETKLAAAEVNRQMAGDESKMRLDTPQPLTKVDKNGSIQSQNKEQSANAEIQREG